MFYLLSVVSQKMQSISKKSFLQKMNIKNGNVVTANCNVYNETLHPWNFFCFFFRRTYGCLVFYNKLLTTEAHEYGTRRQKVFPKVVITKIVIKNSYALETFQNNNQDKVKPFENSFLFFGKFAGSRHNVSE